MSGPLILNDLVESLYYLEGVNFNPNTHCPIDAVRTTLCRDGDTHPDSSHSGAAYYLTVTTVVLFSLGAMTSKTVCQCPALLTVLASDPVEQLALPIMHSK